MMRTKTFLCGLKASIVNVDVVTLAPASACDYTEDECINCGSASVAPGAYYDSSTKQCNGK